MPLAVLDGAILRCDKGTTDSRLSATHDTNLQGFGKRAASVLDHRAGENIQFFGTCRLSGKPCDRVTPRQWFPGARAVSTSGARPLSSDSFLLCVAHGPAAIQIEDPGQLMLFVEAEPFPAAPLGPYYYIYRHYDFLRRHPGETPPDYYLGYGNKFLGLFSELDLSNRGEDWITAVARDLQEAIESLRRSDPGAFDRMERDGKALRHYAFASHPEIYRRNGFLELSTFDKAKIMALVSGNTAFDEIPEFLEQALGLAGQAVKHPVATALDILDSNLIETPKHIVEELPRPWEWDW